MLLVCLKCHQVMMEEPGVPRGFAGIYLGGVKQQVKVWRAPWAELVVLLLSSGAFLPVPFLLYR